MQVDSDDFDCDDDDYYMKQSVMVDGWKSLRKSV